MLSTFSACRKQRLDSSYFRQLAALNLAERWTRADVPVPAIYGASDFITEEADHQRIVDIVNGVHPGNATLAVIPGMDHYFTPEGHALAV